MDAPDKEKVIAKMLGRGLRHGSSGSAAACPDADVLAAYYDHSLSDSETARWELHFAGCERCQRVLTTLAVSDSPVVTAEAQVAKPPRPSWPRLLDWRWVAPVGAAAAAVALWVALRPAPPGILSRGMQPLTQEARNIPPTPPAETDLTSRAATAAPKDSAKAKEEAVRATLPPVRETSTAAQKRARASSQPAVVDLGRTESRPAAPERDARALAGQVRRDEQVISAGAGTQQNAAAAGTAGAAGPVVGRPTIATEEKAQPLQPSRLQQQTDKAATATPQPAAQATTAPTGTKEAAQKKAQEKFAAATAGAGAPPAGAATLEYEAKEPVKKSAEGQRRSSAGSRAPAPEPAIDRRHLRLAFQPADLVIPSPRQELQWRVGATGRIERSRDAGRTWQAQVSGVDTDLLAGSAPSERVCWVVGRAGTILRTTDSEHWEKVASPAPADWIGVEARDALHVTVIAANRRRYVTNDGGRTWKSASPK